MLYTPEQRRRRDASPWTLVQGVLAPLQFLVMLGSAVLIVLYLRTGDGYGIATASVLLKTGLLYLIMVTGAIWEREVFGKYLFAGPFFWEDVVSSGVILLHTLYLGGLFVDGVDPRALMILALVAYAAYTVNAIQFVLKLRAARKQEARARAATVGAALEGVS
jgi:3-vinyl bacteriochlorophyllide hydratase